MTIDPDMWRDSWIAGVDPLDVLKRQYSVFGNLVDKIKKKLQDLWNGDAIPVIGTLLAALAAPAAAKYWSKPKRCLWLVNQDDVRPCASRSNEIFGMGGMHKCYNREDQKAMGGKGTYCGSNYDPFGQVRFEKAPLVGKAVSLAQCDPMASGTSASADGKSSTCDTVPIQLDDWSRFSTGLFKTLYPEFEGDLNFGYTNFDNMFSAFVTLFQAVTMEGWTIIMYHMMDAAWPALSVFLFVTLFAVGSMLILNLVLGAIVGALDDEEDAEVAEF